MSTEAEYHYWGRFDVIKSNGQNLPPAPDGWELSIRSDTKIAYYHDTTDKDFHNWEMHIVHVGDYIELDPYGCFSFHIPEAVFDRYFTMVEV